MKTSVIKSYNKQVKSQGFIDKVHIGNALAILRFSENNSYK
jgi:hypothetical protein